MNHALINLPLAMMPERIHELASLLDHSAGSAPAPGPESTIRARIEAAAKIDGAARARRVAVIPIIGPLLHRPSGRGMNYQDIAAALDAAAADSSINAIVLDVDSPGGIVYGAEELAARISALRRDKPIIAVANPLMASAAYYIASQAASVVATPSAEIGSIGVIAMHINAQKLYERIGLEITEVSAGKYKTELSDIAPLSEEARAWLQAEVDRYYGLFVSAVARGRGVSTQHVMDAMGQGRVLGADQAQAARMIDRVQTLEDVIARLAGSARGAAPSAMHPGAVKAWSAAQKLRA